MTDRLMDVEAEGRLYRLYAETDKARIAWEKEAKRERILTPEPFRDLMVSLAESCIGWQPPGPKNIQRPLEVF